MTHDAGVRPRPQRSQITDAELFLLNRWQRLPGLPGMPSHPLPRRSVAALARHAELDGESLAVNHSRFPRVHCMACQTSRRLVRTHREFQLLGDRLRVIRQQDVIRPPMRRIVSRPMRVLAAGDASTAVTTCRRATGNTDKVGRVRSGCGDFGLSPDLDHRSIRGGGTVRGERTPASNRYRDHHCHGSERRHYRKTRCDGCVEDFRSLPDFGSLDHRTFAGFPLLLVSVWFTRTRAAVTAQYSMPSHCEPSETVTWPAKQLSAAKRRRDVAGGESPRNIASVTTKPR